MNKKANTGIYILLGIIIVLLIVGFLMFNSSKNSDSSQAQNNIINCGNLGTVTNTPTSSQQTVLNCWRENLDSCSLASIEWVAATDGSSGQDTIISKNGNYCKISSSAGGKIYSCDVPQDFIDNILNNPSIGSGFFATIDLVLWTGKINQADYNNGQEVILKCNND
mgnify:CR=1 FL=1